MCIIYITVAIKCAFKFVNKIYYSLQKALIEYEY